LFFLFSFNQIIFADLIPENIILIPFKNYPINQRVIFLLLKSKCLFENWRDSCDEYLPINDRQGER